MAQQPPQKPAESAEHGHHVSRFKPGTPSWYFEEFWPVMIFGTCFVLMMAVPLALSSGFAKVDFYSQGAQVWGPYGLLIIGAFILAFLIAFTLPAIMGLYILCLGVYSLILVENATATAWGPWIALFFLLFVLVGNIYMYLARKS